MPFADKVQSSDSRLRDRYNQRVLEAFEDEEIQLQVEALASLMVRFRAGDDVSTTLVEELHGDLKEKTIRIRKKVGSKLRDIPYWTRSLVPTLTGISLCY